MDTRAAARRVVVAMLGLVLLVGCDDDAPEGNPGNDAGVDPAGGDAAGGDAAGGDAAGGDAAGDDAAAGDAAGDDAAAGDAAGGDGGSSTTCDTTGFTASTEEGGLLAGAEEAYYYGVSSGTVVDALLVEVYSFDDFPPGSYQLDGSDYDTCDLCVLIWHACPPMPETHVSCDEVFWAYEGGVEITAVNYSVGSNFSGTLQNVVFRQVNMSASYEMQLVENGDVWCVDDFSFNVQFVDWAK